MSNAKGRSGRTRSAKMASWDAECFVFGFAGGNMYRYLDARGLPFCRESWARQCQGVARRRRAVVVVAQCLLGAEPRLIARPLLALRYACLMLAVCMHFFAAARGKGYRRAHVSSMSVDHVTGGKGFWPGESRLRKQAGNGMPAVSRVTAGTDVRP